MGLSGQRGATGLGVLPGEAPALPGEERGFCLPSAPGVTEGAASPRAALHAGGMGTACYLPVTEPDPLAFAAFASSHGGNKQRVLQAAAREERRPCPRQRWGAGRGGHAPAPHSSDRACLCGAVQGSQDTGAAAGAPLHRAPRGPAASPAR